MKNISWFWFWWSAGSCEAAGEEEMRAEAPMESSDSKVIGPGGGDQSQWWWWWCKPMMIMMMTICKLLDRCLSKMVLPNFRLKVEKPIWKRGRWRATGEMIFLQLYWAFCSYFVEKQHVNCFCSISCFKVDKPFLALFVLFWRGHVGSSLISEIYDNCLFLYSLVCIFLTYFFVLILPVVRWHYKFLKYLVHL